MADGPSDTFETLSQITAVLTLPLGILAAWLIGGTAAGVVFVVGWLLLVPLFAVLADDEDEDLKELMEVAERAQELEGDRSDESEDPLETLRERYARGEIDEVEFERRLERLVETDEIPDHAVRDMENVAGDDSEERGAEELLREDAETDRSRK